jgi:hypothetical protein
MVGIRAHDFPDVGYWTIVGVGTILVSVTLTVAGREVLGGLSVGAAVGEGELPEQPAIAPAIIMADASKGPNFVKFVRPEIMEAPQH